MNKTAKQLLCLLLALALALTATGCNKKAGKKTGKKNSAKSSSSVPFSSSQGVEDLNEEEENADPFEENEEDAVEYTQLGVANGSTPLNTNFLGFGVVHMSIGYLPDGTGAGRLPMEDWQVEKEFDRIAKTMRVGMVRTIYGPAMVWDQKQQKFEWDPEKNAALKGFYKGINEWQKRKVQVAISPIWGLSGLLETDNSWKNADAKSVNYTGFEGKGLTVNGDYQTTLQNFKSFVSKTVLNLEANGIHNARLLTAFTECNNTYLYINAPKGAKALPQDATTHERRRYDILCQNYADAIKTLDAGLKESGLRSKYKIIGPCDVFQNDNNLDYTDPEQYSVLTKYTLEHLSGYVDIIGTHQYSNGNDFVDSVYYDNVETTMGKTIRMAKAAGKQIWLDEFNASLNGSMAYDERVIVNADPVHGVAQAATYCGILNSGLNTAFLWSVADVQWPNMRSNFEFRNGLQLGGLMPSPLVSNIPYKPWYAVSLITRYTTAGTVYRCEQGSDLYLSVLKRQDGRYTVIVVNYNVEEMPVRLNFEKSLGKQTFYRHLYTTSDVVPTAEAKIIGTSHILKNVTRTLHDTLPGYSVAVYTTDPD